MGTNPDGSPVIAGLEPLALTRGETRTSEGTDFSVELRGFGEYTLLIAKKDPGAAIVWTAFGLLLVGLLITFWMPRRRVWGRLDADGRLALVFLADRYVDVGREFGRLLDDLVAARRPGADAERAAERSMAPDESRRHRSRLTTTGDRTVPCGSDSRPIRTGAESPTLSTPSPPSARFGTTCSRISFRPARAATSAGVS